MHGCSVLIPVIPAIPSCRLVASDYWVIVAVCWSSSLLSGVWRGHWLVAGSRCENESGSQEGTRGIRKSAGRGGLQHGPACRFPSQVPVTQPESDRPLAKTTETSRLVGCVRVPRCRIKSGQCGARCLHDLQLPDTICDGRTRLQMPGTVSGGEECKTT